MMKNDNLIASSINSDFSKNRFSKFNFRELGKT